MPENPVGQAIKSPAKNPAENQPARSHRDQRHTKQVTLRPLIIAATLLAPAFAGEYVVLSSGLRIHADRHEADGGMVRLVTKDGAIELPAGAIVAFEEEDYVPPPPAAPEPSRAPVAPKAPEPAHANQDPKQLVHDAAVRSGLPPEFVHSVAKVESGFQPRAVSPKGAIGVMQLMPETARSLGADPTDTVQNIDAGTRLLRELLLKYNGDVVRALAAYNAGSGAVDHFKGLPPYDETRQYVNKVINTYKQSGGE